MEIIIILLSKQIINDLLIYGLQRNYELFYTLILVFSFL
jgi:hypothetical protein